MILESVSSSSRTLPGKEAALIGSGEIQLNLNESIFVVGGYDGVSWSAALDSFSPSRDVLRSAERLDPRDHSWTRIRSMNTKRGAHSLVVLNEKLYAVGGHDGEKMVPDVEIYEPRVGTWMAGEPMDQNRGYLGAAFVKDTIYAVGGITAGSDIVDLVECYKEGQGWQSTNLRSVGKKCYASAIVLGDD